LFAQSAANSGQIAGEVLDPSGASIPGVEVSVRNIDTNYRRAANIRMTQGDMPSARCRSELIRALPADVSDFNRWDRVLQKDSGNVDALENMASRLRAAGLYQSSNEFYEKAVKLDSVKKNSALRQALLGEMGLNFLDLRDGKKAASIFERCIKESPNTRERPIFLLGLGRAYALIKKKDDARKMLNAVISEFPNSQSAEEARKLLPEL